MKRSTTFFLTAFLILVLSGLACQAATGGTAPADAPESTQPVDIQAQSTEPAQDTPSSAVSPATMTSKGPGFLCAGSRGEGLSCLDENGWQVYTDKNSDLPNNYLYAGAICPDGQIAIAHIRGVSLFDGKNWKQIPENDEISSPEGIACDANGGIWVAHFKGVSYYAEGKWTTYGAENLASGESSSDLVYDVEAAPDGKIWVLAARSVALFEDNTWTVFQEGQGFNTSVFFNAITLDAKGRPWVAHSGGVFVYEEDAWQETKKTGYDSPKSIAVDAKGQIWLGTLNNGVFLFDGNTWAKYDRASENTYSNSVGALTADSGGRLWLGTSYGLTVFDGANWQTLRMNNSGLGDNNVEFILVANDGPVLPALEEKEKASLTGKLEDANHKPLAGMRVEICVERLGSSFSGETPCSDQPFFISTQTDENGVFLIEDVPTGHYVIVAETGAGWAQLTDQFGISSERTLIAAGEKHDIGTLTLEK